MGSDKKFGKSQKQNEVRDIVKYHIRYWWDDETVAEFSRIAEFLENGDTDEVLRLLEGDNVSKKQQISEILIVIAEADCKLVIPILDKLIELTEDKDERVRDDIVFTLLIVATEFPGLLQRFRS